MSKRNRERLAEIVSWLNAYRNGWIAYDAAHVAALQDQRARLIGIEG